MSVSSPLSSVAIDSTAVHSKYRICTSRECAKMSTLFLSNLNEGLDPCNDMFEFACHNYKLTHELDASELHSTITDLQLNVLKKLRRLLEV